jgi:predicted transcriptional regulator
MQAGVPRSAAETLTELHEQVELACLGVKAAVEARQTDTSVKDSYTNHWINDLLRRLRKLKKADPNFDSAQIVQQLKDWVKQNESTIYNPFLSLKGKFILPVIPKCRLLTVLIGFDVSKDTPIEIVHTILLGIVKYAWHSTHASWTPVKKVTYTLRLQATNTTGLSIPTIRANYIMQFANSLIGQQFKQVAQTCIFHMHNLMDRLQFTAWKAMGELLPLLWYPEIDNLDQYLVSIVDSFCLGVLKY